jgi:hypothetical protein
MHHFTLSMSASPCADLVVIVRCTIVAYAFYDLPDPARLSSLIPIVGILLKRLLFVVDDDFAELGDEV